MNTNTPISQPTDDSAPPVSTQNESNHGPSIPISTQHDPDQFLSPKTSAFSSTQTPYTAPPEYLRDDCSNNICDQGNLDRVNILSQQNLTRVLTDVGDFATYNSLNNEIDQTIYRPCSRASIHSLKQQSLNRQPSTDKDNHINESSNSLYTIFTNHEIVYITFLASCCAFFSTISVPIYLSALDELANEFHVSVELINITVTVYSIIQGLSPAIWGSLADSIGRRPIVISCLVVYIGANIGLALAKNYGFLIGFRILQAGGIASTVTVGSGIIGDITERKNRGFYMGIFSGISMIGNAIGPLIGGALAGTLGWRSIFWFLVIASGIIVAVTAFMLPETSRKQVGNGSIPPKSVANKSPYTKIRQLFVKGAKSQKPDLTTLMPPSPIKITRTFDLFLEKDTFIILLPNALHYTSWFMLITAQSTLLTKQYHFNTVRLGLSYLANGGGSVLGSLVSGRVMNYFYQKEVARFQAIHGVDKANQLINERDPSFNIHRARLAPLPIVSSLQIAGQLIFGWTIEKNVHYAVPIVFTALVSFASLFSYNLSATLMVDLFPKDSSSAGAAVNLTRCLLCAAGVSAVESMDRAMGTGGTFTLMSGLLLASWGLNLFEIKYGPKFQKERLQRIELQDRQPKGLVNQNIDTKC